MARKKGSQTKSKQKPKDVVSDILKDGKGVEAVLPMKDIFLREGRKESKRSGA